MPMKAFINLLTGKQAVAVYGFAGVTRDRLPRKGQVATFPSPFYTNITFSIRKTVFEATYGGKLFEITHNTGEAK